MHDNRIDCNHFIIIYTYMHCHFKAEKQSPPPYSIHEQGDSNDPVAPNLRRWRFEKLRKINFERANWKLPIHQHHPNCSVQNYLCWPENVFKLFNWMDRTYNSASKVFLFTCRFELEVGIEGALHKLVCNVSDKTKQLWLVFSQTFISFTIYSA